MPLILGQHLDNTWQMYTLPNYYLPNSSFDEPNTFKGELTKSPNKTKAIEMGTKKLVALKDEFTSKLNVVLDNMIKEEKASADSWARRQEEIRKSNEVRDAEMKAEAKRTDEYIRRNGDHSSALHNNTGRQSHIRIMGDTNRKIQYLKSITK